MTKNQVVIDTNVIVVANGQNGNATTDCTNACVQFLSRARAESVVILDSGDEVRREYARQLQMSRPYKVGAQFLVHVIQQQWNTEYVRVVHLNKLTSGEYVDFPNVAGLQGFDHSDRKFAALAKLTTAPVSNATDSDWANYWEALYAHGISVNFVCGCDRSRWFGTRG